jgi:hypothetical protein
MMPFSPLWGGIWILQWLKEFEDTSKAAVVKKQRVLRESDPNEGG